MKIYNTITHAFAALGLFAVGLTMASGPAHAIPELQVGIIGGTFDPVTEDTVTAADVFTLYLTATPEGVADEGTILGLEHFLSIAVTPKQTETTPPPSLGSFTLNGTTINVAGDMTFGTPPIDATANPLLGPHGIFATYFFEESFFFIDTPATTATPFNVVSNPGGTPDTSGSGMFFKTFQFDITNLDASIELHFDGYNTKVKMNQSITVGDFTPRSKDASTVPNGGGTPDCGTPGAPPCEVPEPIGLGLLGLGLAGLGIMRRRRKTV